MSSEISDPCQSTARRYGPAAVVLAVGADAVKGVTGSLVFVAYRAAGEKVVRNRREILGHRRGQFRRIGPRRPDRRPGQRQPAPCCPCGSSGLPRLRQARGAGSRRATTRVPSAGPAHRGREPASEDIARQDSPVLGVGGHLLHVAIEFRHGGVPLLAGRSSTGRPRAGRTTGCPCASARSNRSSQRQPALPTKQASPWGWTRADRERPASRPTARQGKHAIQEENRSAQLICRPSCPSREAAQIGCESPGLPGGQLAFVGQDRVALDGHTLDADGNQAIDERRPLPRQSRQAVTSRQVVPCLVGLPAAMRDIARTRRARAACAPFIAEAEAAAIIHPGRRRPPAGSSTGGDWWPRRRGRFASGSPPAKRPRWASPPSTTAAP